MWKKYHYRFVCSDLQLPAVQLTAKRPCANEAEEFVSVLSTSTSNNAELHLNRVNKLMFTCVHKHCPEFLFAMPLL